MMTVSRHKALATRTLTIGTSLRVQGVGPGGLALTLPAIGYAVCAAR